MTDTIPMLDLMFFLTETQDNPRHVGSVLIFQKPRGGGDRTTRQIVDAYRRAKPQPPFNRIPVFRKVGLPVWKEVESFDPAHHVLHLALPSPGSNEQLHELIADLHAPMFERHRPGWKMYVIDGLAGDRFAIYHKVHHALVDYVVRVVTATRRPEQFGMPDAKSWIAYGASPRASRRACS